ncbi:hypothetical protein Droror1_Dr00001526 [Drosera rotundifolia]
MEHPRVLPQLEKLTLDTKGMFYRSPEPCAIFNNARRLVLKGAPDPTHGVVDYFSLVKTSPLLNTLIVQLYGPFGCCLPREMSFRPDDIEKMLEDKVGETRHKNLEVMRFEGFWGFKGENELALCLARYATSLRHLKISIRLLTDRGQDLRRHYSEIKVKSLTLRHFEWFKAALPSKVQLEVF